MENTRFKYDTRLKERELQLFQDLIGKSIATFRLENGTVVLPPHFKVSNKGKCAMDFFSKETGSFTTIELTSLFKETPPVVDSGGVAIERINNSPARKNLGVPQYQKAFTIIGYPEKSAIESFKFFGSKERRALKLIDPDLDEAALKEWGFTGFPLIEVDTIEFIIIEHTNKAKTIISIDSGGFWYNFLVKQPINDCLCYDSYVKVNGYEKNIVLHHEIK